MLILLKRMLSFVIKASTFKKTNNTSYYNLQNEFIITIGLGRNLNMVSSIDKNYLAIDL